jgi:hypothetical protein
MNSSNLNSIISNDSSSGGGSVLTALPIGEAFANGDILNDDASLACVDIDKLKNQKPTTNQLFYNLPHWSSVTMTPRNSSSGVSSSSSPSQYRLSSLEDETDKTNACNGSVLNDLLHEQDMFYENEVSMESSNDRSTFSSGGGLLLQIARSSQQSPSSSTFVTSQSPNVLMSTHQFTIDLCTSATSNLKLADTAKQSEIVAQEGQADLEAIESGSHQQNVNLNKRKLVSALSANQLAAENSNENTDNHKLKVDHVSDSVLLSKADGESVLTKPSISKRFYLDDTEESVISDETPLEVKKPHSDNINNNNPGEKQANHLLNEIPMNYSRNLVAYENSIIPVGSHANDSDSTMMCTVNSDHDNKLCVNNKSDNLNTVDGDKECLGDSNSTCSSRNGDECSPISVSTKHIKSVQRFPRTNFPLSSSPAPIRKSGSAFDFDNSLKHPKSIKK